MKKVQFEFVCLLLAISLLSSCKKDTASNSSQQPNPNPTTFTILKSNQWKVLAQQSLPMNEGVLGGGRGATAFTTQKPDELRWYSLHRTMSNISGHNEMILNTKGEVTINSNFTHPSYGGDIKGFIGSDIWKINVGEVANQIYAFKNDQLVDLSKYPEGQEKIIRIQATEDGMLNCSESNTSNYVSYYHYATQKWKSNFFTGNNFVTLRYKGLTYAICFTRLTSANGITIWEESNNRVETQDPQIPTIKTVRYPMTNLKYIPGEYGWVIHSATYGDEVFVAFHSHTSNTRFGVVKVNLTNHTAELIQAPEQKAAFGGTQYVVLNNVHSVEVDDKGNLYVVESRNENNKAYYSIRKYLTNGQTEVILKESDLAFNTNIQGLKFFNGKLHVAVMNKEDIPDGNPNDNNFKVVYHKQIIAPN